jgi:integrase
MAVRKRTWTTATGEKRERWLVDYYAKDAEGKSKRCFETFERSRDAHNRAATIKVDISKGVFVPPSTSITIAEAAKLWLEVVSADELDGHLERTTTYGYRTEVRHLLELVGNTKLAYFTVAAARQLESDLRKKGHSRVMTQRCLQTLARVFSDAQERGLCATNPVSDLKRKRGKRGEKKSARDRGKKLKVGVDIPSRQEIKAILEHAPAEWKTLLMVAAFTGLRASELRGLRWKNVDLPNGVINVVERADRYNVMGATKSDHSNRTVPLADVVVDALKEWTRRASNGTVKLLHPGDYVFPAQRAKTLSLQTMVASGLEPAVRAAKLFNADGKPKYTGFHSLRHFYASWCINRKPDGCELPPKEVQDQLGHSTLAMTMDRYGHLFPRSDSSREDMNRAAKAILG